MKSEANIRQDWINHYVDDSFADDDFQSMTNKFDDRFAERHRLASSGTVITQCHPERSSRSVISEAVIHKVVITQCHPERSSRSVISEAVIHKVVIRFAVEIPLLRYRPAKAVK